MIKIVPVQTALQDSSIELVHSISSNKEHYDDVSFLINYTIDSNKAITQNKNQSQIGTGANADYNCITCIKKYDLNLNNLEFEYGSSQTNSMIIQDELVYEVIMYSKSKMIASVSPTDLLMIDNWTVVKRIVDPQPGNV